ncbi:MAG: alpha-ketoglutarate-dependent dioxygenase AlkB [Pseudomonadota bacterium]
MLLRLFDDAERHTRMDFETKSGCGPMTLDVKQPAGDEERPAGFESFQGYFDAAGQRELVAWVHRVAEIAPFFTPMMPKTGKPFSVQMTNAGALGWISDRTGYKYVAEHPVTGVAWPPVLDLLHTLWREVAPDAPEPEACLINLYRGKARLGSHVDRDEAVFDAPVVSISLGDDAVFHVGGRRRKDPKTRMTLRSGDVVVLGGEARLAYHGIDRVMPGTSDLLAPDGGRINLTLRRVTGADDENPDR